MCNQRMQHDWYRAQHTTCRRHRSGYYGGGFGSLIVGAIILAFFIHSFWLLFPLLFCGIPLFLFVLRPALMNNTYQARARENPPVYQPYNQGYQPQQPPVTPAAATQERRQQGEVLEQTRQYEEPLTMYPRE